MTSRPQTATRFLRSAPPSPSPSPPPRVNSSSCTVSCPSWWFPFGTRRTTYSNTHAHTPTCTQHIARISHTCFRLRSLPTRGLPHPPSLTRISLLDCFRCRRYLLLLFSVLSSSSCALPSVVRPGFLSPAPRRVYHFFAVVVVRRLDVTSACLLCAFFPSFPPFFFPISPAALSCFCFVCLFH